MSYLRTMIVIGLVLVAMVSAFPSNAQEGDTQTPDEICNEAIPQVTEPETRTYDEAEDVLEEGIDYKAIFCTEDGAIYIDLLENLTPITVNNFVFLADNGYYNNTTFHRVIADFMAQGGDPTGTGSGGPGYQFEDEFVPYLAFNTPGWLAMANAGPGTNGSQFFITRVPTPHLNGRHTIFGRVLEGQDVVDDMQNRDPQNPSDAESPGVTLHTVLIVTDDSDIETTYEAPEVATPEEILETVRAIPVDGYTLDEEDTGINIESFGNGTAASAYWRVTECPAEPDLFELGLTVVDFLDEANTAEALADEEFLTGSLAPGYEYQEEASETVEGQLYFRPTESCDTGAEAYRYVWERGRYLLIMDFVVGEGIVPEENRAVAAANLSTAFERNVGDIILAGTLSE